MERTLAVPSAYVDYICECMSWLFTLGNYRGKIKTLIYVNMSIQLFAEAFPPINQNENTSIFINQQMHKQANILMQ